jgi:Secretion system C-terminal sorting domain
MKHITQQHGSCKRRWLLLLGCCLVAFASLQAQSITWTFVNAAGFEDGDQGSLRWTIGEPVTVEVSDGTASLRMGFLPFAFMEDGSSATHTLRTDIDITIAPNPASELINVHLPEATPYTIRILSMDGTTQMETTATAHVQIDLNRLPVGAYLLYAIDPDGSFNTKTFIKS